MTGQSARMSELAKPALQGCSLSEGTVSIFPANAQLAQNTMFNCALKGLTAFPRAQAMAQLFQEYRITRVRVIIYPASNTVIAGAPTSVIKMYDRVYSTPYAATSVSGTLITLDLLRELNPHPFLLTQRRLLRSFKPTVATLTNSVGSATLPSFELKTSPWLSTSVSSSSVQGPDDTTHRGMLLYFLNDLAPTTATVATTVDIEADFEFRKPATVVYVAPSPSSA